ncbi:hypothetical protein BDF19DRAFT_388386 [Syncephalis fuscata]|nr:hypothetical protein BDF19DRAFT_388386 [Syncephalis fuscata]
MPLAVRAGPSYTQQTLINVNDDQYPVLIDSTDFTGRVVVRIKDFTGITPSGETRITNTNYFKGRRRKFSIQVEGRFKKAVSADDVYYGVDFDDIPAIPKIFDIGMAAARLIDPAVYYNAQTEKPYIMSPLLCGINAFNIRDAPELFDCLPLAEYQLGGERALEEDTRIQLPSADPKASMPYKKRRKYFLNQANRQSFMFMPDKQYGFDFYSPHMDFNTFQLKLGVSVKVDKYLGGRPIRYVCRSLDGKITYFVITFNLEN